MSETDDTDDLLLIPPDFFAVQAEPEPPYYNIVDKLIRQVSNLQDRIEGIESMSDASFVGSNLDNCFIDTKMSLLYPKNHSSKRYYSHDDIYQPFSTQSTPQKALDKNKLNSLPNTPSINKFSPTRKNNVRFSSPQRTSLARNEESEVLQEIDTFMSNVKTIQRNQAVRNLQKDFNDVRNNKGIEELDKQSQKNSEAEKKVQSWKCGNNIERDYNLGAGDLLGYNQKSNHFKPNYQSNSTLDKSSDSSSESTQLTAFNRTKKPSDELKCNEQFQSVKDKEIPRKFRSINTLNSNLGFLNLADIWGSSELNQSPSKLSQKLQEEKLRRQHCELLIQDLQSKNLEFQEKLAVALKVDETKNQALQEYRETLDTVSAKMDKLIEEKSTWERELVKLKNQHSIEIESANQKVTYYEKEASKSLNLVHGNQEKISDLEKRCSDLQSKLDQLDAKCKEVNENYEKEFEKNKQLVEIITHKEIELKENKSVLNTAREEVAHSRKAVEVCQTEFTALKDECNRLQNELKTDKNKILSLNEHKRKLLGDLESYKQIEKALKDNLEQSKQKLENTKLELRNFYQGQLEIIVENKRKEMQNQLDKERQNSQEEIKRKELSMAKTAANHIKEISEKCTLEIKLLEQKHQEEIRLYQMQLTQSQKEIEHLRSKLAHLPEKRAQIAKQIQKVMENQFNEALKMIEDSPTPVVNNDYREPDISTKTFQPVMNNHQEHCRKEQTFESVSDFDETPVSSRGGAKQSDSEIQKYINMLLNRPPGNPVPETHEAKPSQSQQRTSWHPSDLENQNKVFELRQSSIKDRKNGKPPWK